MAQGLLSSNEYDLVDIRSGAEVKDVESVQGAWIIPLISARLVEDAEQGVKVVPMPCLNHDRHLSPSL